LKEYIRFGGRLAAIENVVSNTSATQ
jgi:hypothetical protein